MSGRSAGAGESRGRGRPGLREALHLAALSSFAIAAPLFVVANPQFFIGRGAEPVDILVLAVLMTVGPPTLLFAVELAASRLSRRLGAALHLVFVGLLAAAFGSQLILFLGLDALLHGALALALGAGAAAAYARLAGIRSFVTALSPAPLIFLAYFLLAPPMSKLTLASEDGIALAPASSTTPVVMVVFDEFPGYVLMDEQGGIDEVRYPSFARLAEDATWFPNATTPRSDTEIAVPSVVTGKVEPLDSLATAPEHPQSLFTLLGRSHETHSSEPWTDLCPERICPETSSRSVTDRVGSILGTVPWILARLWIPDADELGLPRPRESGAPNRVVQFREFIAGIRPGERPRLHFLHVLFPHKPWRYMPSGRRYPDSVGRDGWLTGFARWGEDEWVTLQRYQQFLLQVGFMDRLIGELLDRLHETGLYDRSLIVITADHGVSFRADDKRRNATPTNAPDILSVPLFVKAPGQRRGRVDESPVKTIDILPTVAELTGATLTWEPDGRSLYANGPPRRVAIENKIGGRIEMSPAEYERRLDAALERQVALFGDGGDGSGRLYGIGPHLELVGRPAAALRGSPLDAGFELAAPDLLGAYDPESHWVPARIGGTVDGLEPGRELAVAVNGRIEATTRTYAGSGGVAFTAMVDPERGLRPGRNEVEVFLIEDGLGSPRLRALAGTGA